jgi:hypothetical protein
MRFHEFTLISETDGMGGVIEDEAVTRGDNVLATALEELRNRARGHTVPRVRMDALVSLVKKLPGGEMFNAEALTSAKKSNETIGNLITDIKDDANGVKYVYLAPFGEEQEEQDADVASAEQSASVVSGMARRAGI